VSILDDYVEVRTVNENGDEVTVLVPKLPQEQREANLEALSPTPRLPEADGCG
jgi:hypothetical protein